MKKELHPAVAVVAGVIVLALLIFFGYRAMQPAYYRPSPGVGGTPATTTPDYGKPGAPHQPSRPYTQPPANATPGMPMGAGK